MNIYDLKNYNYKYYNYSENTLMALKKTKRIATSIKLILIIITLIIALINFKLIYLCLIIAIIGRVIETKIVVNIKNNLLKNNTADFHDYMYYYYCKKRSKATHNMYLLNLVYANIIMKRYEQALQAIELIDPNTAYVKSKLFIYEYYYGRIYKELGEVEKYEEVVASLNALIKEKGLNKELVKQYGVTVTLNKLENE